MGKIGFSLIPPGAGGSLCGQPRRRPRTSPPPGASDPSLEATPQRPGVFENRPPPGVGVGLEQSVRLASWQTDGQTDRRWLQQLESRQTSFLESLA